MKKKNRTSQSIVTQLKRMLIMMSILFLMLCIFINYSMQRITIENANDHSEVTAKKLSSQMEFLYEKMDSYSLMIVNQEEIQKMMSEESYSGISSHVSAMQELIAYYKIMDPNIEDISLVNEMVHYSTVYDYSELDQLREESGESRFVWLGVRSSTFLALSENEDMLVFARNVFRKGENVGTLIISVDVTYLQMENENEPGQYYLLADENEIRYSFGEEDTVVQEIWENWNMIPEKENRMYRNSWVYYSTFSGKMNCWEIVALNTHQVREHLSVMRNLLWACIVVIVIFAIALFFLINTRIVIPLGNFRNVIRKIREEGKREISETPDLGECLEMQEIGEEFTGMLNDIDRLNRKIFDTATDLYEEKVQRQQAELSYMKSQIDPHFLYNTLEMVRKCALEKGADDVAQMSLDMGNIFRYSTKGEDVVPLSDEISIIKSYMRIQQNRFTGKIKVFYFLPTELLQYRVMKMLLQPIVENAVFHGLEPKEAAGNVYIGARLDEKDLLVTIKDDGVGISEDRLNEIRSQLSKDHFDTSRHVGILNTHARIRLRYGAPYGISVESEVQDGVTITLRLPVLEEIESEG